MSIILLQFSRCDHSISLPILRAIKKRYGPVGLIHFDAHSDLWHGYFDNKDTHGTPFRRAIEEELIDTTTSSQIGLRGPLYDKNDSEMSKDAGLLSITGPELHSMGILEALSLVKNRIGNRPAYLTFDIGFYRSSFCSWNRNTRSGWVYWL